VRASLRNLLLGATVALLAACVPLPPPGAVFIGARFGPPAPRVEVIGVAPGPGFVWIRGFYRWNGGAYLWVPGRWERPPYARAVWVPGRWVRHPRQGWYWVDGRWRGHGRYDDDGGRRDR
jgi:WXXGXW repeat (2 copies)